MFTILAGHRMALVAGYGSSDDDAEEDGDDEVASVVPPRNSVAKASAANEPLENRPEPLPNASSASLRLPPPIGVSEKTSEVALEDFVKSKSYENTATSDATLPRLPKSTLKLPPPKYKERQTVKRITVPALSSYDSDEDDGPAAKKPKAAAAARASGLLASLPPPRNATVKDLVPHSLTKPAQLAPRRTGALQAAAAAAAAKRPPSAAAAASAAASSLRDSQRDGDEGDGEESANFFSLESAPRQSGYGGPASARPGSGIAGSLWASASSSVPDHRRPAASEPGSQSTEVYSSYSDPSVSAAGLQTEEPSADSYSAAAYAYEAAADDSTPAPSCTMLADEQFLRLQGKKQRGKEEINIVDVCEDDFRASQLELTKTLSQEVDPRSFSHRKKGEGPSTQEKRKHQITYLAFQAKERELELKNAWAANRVTRQQTQSKYGF